MGAEESLDSVSRARGTVEKEFCASARWGKLVCQPHRAQSGCASWGVLRRLWSPRELLLSRVSIEGPKIDDPGRMSGAHLLKGRAWQARAEPGPSKGWFLQPVLPPWARSGPAYLGGRQGAWRPVGTSAIPPYTGP